MKGSAYPLATPQPADTLIGIQAGATVRFPVTPAIQAKAQKILRTPRVPTGLLASDPVTIGANGANSTINTSATTAVGSGNVAVLDPRIESVSGLYASDGGAGYISKHNLQADLVSRYGVSGQGLRFGFDGQAFDICLYGVDANAPNRFQVRVTDVATGVRSWAAAIDYMITRNNIQYVKVDFGSRAVRIVEVFTSQSVYVRGLNIGPNDDLWRAAAAGQPRMALMGDSWARGVVGAAGVNAAGAAAAGVCSIRADFAYAMGDALGIDNPIINATSGTGWVRAVAPKFTDRIAGGDFAQSLLGALDLIVIYGSVNDNASTDAAVQAALTDATGGLPALRAAQPGALIAVFGPQYISNATPFQARFDAMKAAVQGLGDPGIVFVDTSPSSNDQPSSGVGFSGSVTATGSISGATLTTTTADSNGAVTGGYIRPGMAVTGAGVSANTTITSGASTGPGAFGITPSQTVASTTLTITGPVGAGSNDILIGPDGVHPANDAAHAVFGRRAAASLQKTLIAMAG